MTVTNFSGYLFPSKIFSTWGDSMTSSREDDSPSSNAKRGKYSLAVLPLVHRLKECKSLIIYAPLKTLSSIQITFCDGNSFADSLVWGIFVAMQENTKNSGGGSWYVYHLPWREFLLLILCALLPNVWRAIRKSHNLLQSLWKRNTRKIISDFPSHNLKMWFARSLDVCSDTIHGRWHFFRLLWCGGVFFRCKREDFLTCLSPLLGRISFVDFACFASKHLKRNNKKCTTDLRVFGIESPEK